MALNLQDPPLDRHRSDVPALDRGHNVGIVSEPDGQGRSFRVMAKKASDHYVDRATWLIQASQKQGSWWPEWAAWLDTRSGEPIAPPSIGAVDEGPAPLGDAPGNYVFQE